MTMDSTSTSTNDLVSNGHRTKSPQTVGDINLDDIEGSTKPKKISFGDELRQYGMSTTHHGVRYAADSKNHVLRRLIWTVLILGANTYLFFNIVTSFSQYLEFDVTTVVGVTYVHDLNFPAVTICNYNQFRKSTVSPLELELINEMYGIEARLLGKPIDWSKFAGLNNYSSPESEDFTSFVASHAHQINDTVFECTWHTVEPCDIRNFTTTLTDWGVCFTFNDPVDENNVLKISQPGRQNGLHLRMDVQQDEYVSSESASAGFKVLLHPQGVRPLLKELGFSISPGFETSVTVSYTQMQNKPTPYTKCKKPNTQHLTYSAIYTLQYCLHECKVNYVISKCGCRDYRYPGNLRVCGPQEIVDIKVGYHQRTYIVFNNTTLYIEKNITCKQCTEPCEAATYEARTSIAYFPNQDVTNQMINLINETEDYIRKNYLDLSIFFEELSYSRVVQKAAYPAATLISDIGGTMGLMVGMSLLTIVESLDFILVWLWHRLCVSERHRQ